MALALRVVMMDDTSGATGSTTVVLADDAVSLTRQSFMTRYAMPAIAAAWEAMSVDAQKRAFASDQFKAETNGQIQ